MDTGSSDLWLYTAGRTVQLTNSSDLRAVEAYGKGQVQGNIAFAQLQIGDFTIESQGTHCLPVSSYIPALIDGL